MCCKSNMKIDGIEREKNEEVARVNPPNQSEIEKYKG